MKKYTLSILFLFVLVGSGCIRMGGCPWTEHGEVTIKPKTSCLDLHLADASGVAPSTGCVNPVLYGKNNCESALSLPKDFSTNKKELTVEKGKSFNFEISYYDVCKVVANDRCHITMPANLGDKKITIEFELYR